MQGLGEGNADGTNPCGITMTASLLCKVLNPPVAIGSHYHYPWSTTNKGLSVRGVTGSILSPLAGKGR